MRREFEITQEQLDELMVAPVPYMIFGGRAPPSMQEMANDRWRALGAKLGFVWDTVLPAPNNDRFFTAEVDDGVFQKHAASELQTPLRNLDAALRDAKAADLTLYGWMVETNEANRFMVYFNEEEALRQAGSKWSPPFAIYRYPPGYGAAIKGHEDARP